VPSASATNQTLYQCLHTFHLCYPCHSAAHKTQPWFINLTTTSSPPHYHHNQTHSTILTTPHGINHLSLN
jgi:hypothetical protein